MAEVTAQGILLTQKMTEVKMGDFSIATFELLKAQREKCNEKNTSIQRVLYFGPLKLKHDINSFLLQICKKTLYQQSPIKKGY